MTLAVDECEKDNPSRLDPKKISLCDLRGSAVNLVRKAFNSS